MCGSQETSEPHSVYMGESKILRFGKGIHVEVKHEIEIQNEIVFYEVDRLVCDEEYQEKHRNTIFDSF